MMSNVHVASIDEKRDIILRDMNNPQVRKAFGRKLLVARERLKLTQTDVAEKSDISPNYYSRIERGEENPTMETIRSILKVLKVKSSDILPF